MFLVVPHVVRSQSLDQVNLRTIDTGPGGQTIELSPHADRLRIRTCWNALHRSSRVNSHRRPGYPGESPNRRE